MDPPQPLIFLAYLISVFFRANFRGFEKGGKPSFPHKLEFRISKLLRFTEDWMPASAGIKNYDPVSRRRGGVSGIGGIITRTGVYPGGIPGRRDIIFSLP